MGMFDEIEVPCPACGKIFLSQSKSGDCCLQRFSLHEAPLEVLGDVNRHAPFTCVECGAVFHVTVKTHVDVVLDTL